MRTLLVTIKDNAWADRIVRELAERQGLLGDEAEPSLTDDELMLELVERAHLDAMVARPTLFCHCGVTKGAGRRAAGYAQSERFKWLVHVPCNRPTEYIVRHWISNMLNGARDLLAEIIPGHETVQDYLDRGARFRVYKQELRDGRRNYTGSGV
jgi:hypothetical protein